MTKMLMNKLRCLIALGLLFTCSCATRNEFDPVGYVDPQIGSVHGRWFFYTPAAVPFGMAKLAPHTNAYGSPGSWYPCGYDDRHGSIEGFGHFHEFQIGGLVIMPVTGPLKTVPGTLEDPDSGYRSRFSKMNETAVPGYYSVLLDDYQIRAELTASQRAGIHRYTYPYSDDAHLIIDIGHRQGESSDVTEAFISKTGTSELEGYIFTSPEYIKFCDPGKLVKMYFVIQLDKTPGQWGTFVDDSIQKGNSESRGTGNGMYLSFSTREGEEIILRVGLSYTSIENARQNLAVELSGRSFSEVREDSYDMWKERLSAIEIEGGRKEDRVKFYTGLYHALLGRGLASDINGQYPRNDGSIGQIPLDEKGIPKYHHYNTDGIWGAFWNLGQLWALAYPDYLSSFMQSNLDFYSETGWLHDGVAAGAYSNGVLTNYNGLMLAAAYHCGIRDYDIEKAFSAAYKNETEYRNRDFGSGKYDLVHFVNNGFIHSYDTAITNEWTFDFGTSHTLEYCFSSFAVSEFAESLGKEGEYDTLFKQAQAYQVLFDQETGFIRPRNLDGTFIVDFDSLMPWRGFQEGNAFQYTWYVPHDPAGMIDLIGIDRFNSRLEMMFTEARKSIFGGGKNIHSFSGLEKLYNHGNQPCLHNAWLFNYSGKPWLTQKWTRIICDEFYGTEPLHGYGFGQDEDQGQLGAWYVMASMGLFDLSGHAFKEPTFQLGSPLFDQITVRLDPEYYEGRELIIKTINNSTDNIYIQSATLNGKPLEKLWIDRNILLQGAELVLEMGPEPIQDVTYEPPPSMSRQQKYNVKN